MILSKGNKIKLAAMTSSQKRDVLNRGLQYFKTEELLNEAHADIVSKGLAYRVTKKPVQNPDGTIKFVKEMQKVTPSQYETLKEYDPISTYKLVVNKTDLINYIHGLKSPQGPNFEEIMNSVNTGAPNVSWKFNDWIGKGANEVRLRLYAQWDCMKFNMFNVITDITSQGRISRYSENNDAPLSSMTQSPVNQNRFPTIYDLVLQIGRGEQYQVLNGIDFIGTVLEYDQTKDLSVKGYDLPQSFMAYFWENKWASFKSWLGSAMWYSATAFNPLFVPAGVPPATPATFNYPAFIKPGESPAITALGTDGFSVQAMNMWDGLWRKIINSATPNLDGTKRDPFGAPKVVPYTGVITTANIQTIFNSIIASSSSVWRGSYRGSNNEIVAEFGDQGTNRPTYAARFFVPLEVWESLQSSYQQAGNFQGALQTMFTTNRYKGYEICPTRDFVGNNVLFGIFNNQTAGSTGGALTIALCTEDESGTPFLVVDKLSDGKDGLYTKFRMGADCAVANPNLFTVYTEYTYSYAYPLPNQNITDSSVIPPPYGIPS